MCTNVPMLSQFGVIFLITTAPLTVTDQLGHAQGLGPMHVACRFSSLHYVALENAHTPQLVKFLQANKKTSLLKALWGLVGKGVINCALSAEDFLRGICQVKEAILVALLGIEVAKGG